MGAEVWAIISVGIVILVAIATSHRALRREMNERIDALGERVTDLRVEMTERFASLRAEMIERFGQLSERLARVESFLEGMGYATWKRASEEHRDGKH